MEQEAEPLKKSTRSKSTTCKFWNPGDINWWIQVVLGLLAVTFFTLFVYYATRDDECAGRTWVHFDASSSSIPHCLRYDDDGHVALDASLCPHKCDAMFNKNARLAGRAFDAPNGRRLAEENQLARDQRVFYSSLKYLGALTVAHESDYATQKATALQDVIQALSDEAAEKAKEVKATNCLHGIGLKGNPKPTKGFQTKNGIHNGGLICCDWRCRYPNPNGDQLCTGEYDERRRADSYCQS